MYNHLAAEGAALVLRGGFAWATGAIIITVSGGATPTFSLNELSLIQTDNAPSGLSTPGASSTITITTGHGIEILGIVRALDSSSDVTLTSGAGWLWISGFVEAGDQLSLTGASALSSSTVSVHLSKLLYETRTRTAMMTNGHTGLFTIDEYGRLIDDDGFLIALDGAGQVILDGEGRPQPVIGTNGYPVLGGQPVYIAYDDTHTPFYVDKEGYRLVEYFELVGGSLLPANGRIAADVTLNLVLDDGLGNRIEGTPVTLSVAETAAFTSVDQLVALLQTRLNTSPYSAVVALERDGALVLSVAGYEIDIAGTSANLEQLGFQSPRDTKVRFFYVDGAGQFLDDQGYVVRPVGRRLDVSGWLIEGIPVDTSGRLIKISNGHTYLIDENGNFLNADGDPINAYGDRVDAHGNLIADDEVTLISYEGYKINEDGLLLNASNGLLNGVGAIRDSVEIGGVHYLTDRYGNLVSSAGELIREVGGSYRLINERGELVDADGIPIVGFQTPVEARRGTPVVVVDPTTLEEPVGEYERWNDGSIQEGGVRRATSGKLLVDLPARRSGGVLNTTGPTGRISIQGDKTIEIFGMVGFVRLGDTGATEVAVTQVDINSLTEVYLGSDALVNAKDSIDITGTRIWAMDESVTIAREPYSQVHLTASGPAPEDGTIHVARSQIYYFRAYVAAQGLLELNGDDIGIYGTVAVEGEDRDDSADSPHSLLQINANRHILVRGEILSAGDVDLNAGLTDVTGSIVVSAEGKVAAGYESSIAGNVTMDAPGEVSLLAYDDTMNDNLQFAPPYVTYEPVLVDVVTGYRRVESGFVLRPVYHWIPTITTEQTGFDDVKVGSEFGSVETRLVQDGYYKVGFGLVDLEDAISVASAFVWAYVLPDLLPAVYSILGHLSEPTMDLLSHYYVGHEPSKDLQNALVADFNRMVVSGTSLYDEEAFTGVTLQSETQTLLNRQPAVTGSDLIRLNRLLIEDALDGIRHLPKSEQFREYFIPQIDYRVVDLDWPGEYDPSTDSIYVSWLGVTVGPGETVPDLSDTAAEKAAKVARQVFQQVTTYGDPIPDPYETTYAQGAAVNNVVSDILAGAQQPALFIHMSPAQYYTDHSYLEVYDELTNAAVQGTLYKSWEDLTQTEQVRAILDYLGYEKLFDVQFLSGFKKTVYVEAPPSFSYNGSLYAELREEVQGLTLGQFAVNGVAAVNNAGIIGVQTVGGKQYELAGSGVKLNGAVVEHEGQQYFVAGTFVNDAFDTSPQFSLGSALLSAGVGLEMDSYEVYKKYFDFWFAEFEPFDPAVHWDHARYDTAEEAALAHFLPPYDMLNEALATIDTAGIPAQFLAGGKIVLSAQAAADYAAIVRSNFTVNGTVMTAAVAQLIYTRVADAIAVLADQFFIAGVDYNEDFSNPEKAAYIASFFEREDTILGGDHWEKLYSPTEGLGRINRNLEGIPTATFWELDFTGDARVVEPYQLDDGSNIFLRVPKDWWENYTVQALGNDRTESDGKKLQYVGNVDTYDETVGYTRNVAQLQYTQAWSTNQVESMPSNPAAGDRYVVEDNDSSPGRWVVTYREDAHPDWPDEYTAFQQYSIHDGRETDEAILPYVYALFTGLITLGSAETGAFQAMSEEELDLMYLLFDEEALDEGLIAEMFVGGDHSVKVPWEPKDWDLGDAGDVRGDGTLYYEDKDENLRLTPVGQFGADVIDYEDDQNPTVSDSDIYDVFGGANWDFGQDTRGRNVFAQMDVGNNVLNVAQDGVTFELIASWTEPASNVGRYKEWTSPYYTTDSGLRTWEEARTASSNGHLVVINDAAENAVVRGLAGSDSVWLGGSNVLGASHSSWSLDWVDGTHISAWGGYNNFAAAEPNDLDDEDYLMMWSNGLWNDLDGTYALRGVGGRPLLERSVCERGDAGGPHL